MLSKHKTMLLAIRVSPSFLELIDKLETFPAKRTQHVFSTNSEAGLYFAGYYNDLFIRSEVFLFVSNNLQKSLIEIRKQFFEYFDISGKYIQIEISDQVIPEEQDIIQKEYIILNLSSEYINPLGDYAWKMINQIDTKQKEGSENGKCSKKSQKKASA